TAAENVAFGLEMRKVPTAEIAPKVGEALRLVRLDKLGDRLPRQLSGGQQQRVALARALVFKPDILLLDEPLSNLDAKLRLEVRMEIRQLQTQFGLTTLMVTHDQEEALTMADRLVVMNDGAVRQVGTQRDLYERPADRFVAGFVGRSSFLEGAIVDGDWFKSRGGLTIRCAGGTPGQATLAIRPERVAIGAASAALENRFTGRVDFVSYLGASLDVHVRLSSEDRILAQIASDGVTSVPSVGDEIEVGWKASASNLFGPDTLDPHHASRVTHPAGHSGDNKP
ncbi:MAG: ABC transporter ATP-binding protein, partial [Proteobacteria bacterium]|nr:ABC transporter ATP-binding protein [Pseudomonadota bacterium]